MQEISFETVVREHLAYVWRIARLLVGEEAADDVVQETFLVARRRLPQFHGRSIQGWLYVIARNVARNRRRGARRYRRVLASLPAEEPGCDLDEAVARREAAELLDRFIRTLSPKRREAFVLLCVEGLPAGEVAQALDVPVQTLHSRARLAREDLRRFVDQAATKEASR